MDYFDFATIADAGLYFLTGTVFGQIILYMVGSIVSYLAGKTSLVAVRSGGRLTLNALCLGGRVLAYPFRSSPEAIAAREQKRLQDAAEREMWAGVAEDFVQALDLAGTVKGESPNRETVVQAGDLCVTVPGARSDYEPTIKTKDAIVTPYLSKADVTKVVAAARRVVERHRLSASVEAAARAQQLAADARRAALKARAVLPLTTTSSGAPKV